MVDVFSSESATEKQKEHIQRLGNNKQGNVDVSRCESAYEKVTITFLDSVKKRGKCGVYVFSFQKP